MKMPFPEFEPKSVRDLCLEVKLSKQRIWKLINSGRIPAPLQISPQKWVYPPQAFLAVVTIIQSARQDRETQRIMRQKLKERKKICSKDRCMELMEFISLIIPYLPTKDLIEKAHKLSGYPLPGVGDAESN
jgi:predicted DNA-binding transcriptional regulator AlpA